MRIPPDDCGHKGLCMAEDGPRCAYCNLLLNQKQIALLLLSKEKPNPVCFDTSEDEINSIVNGIQALIARLSRKLSPSGCPHIVCHRKTFICNGHVEDSGWVCAVCNSKVR